MTNELAVSKGKNALQALAARLKLDPETMKKTLKATAFKDCKTDEEFVAALIVANEYGLNPLTKQIYAFAAKQGGGVVPVVSTDGWTHLLVDHPKYKNHHFTYSDKMVTMRGAKPCPEWCEISIEKQDGTTTTIREYLDEVFRDLSYANPWQTHTKRFLRHKTKIQGTRETFGYGGVYDEDEAERIVEAQVIEGMHGKPHTETTQEVSDKPAEGSEENIQDNNQDDVVPLITGKIINVVPHRYQSKKVKTDYTILTNDEKTLVMSEWKIPLDGIAVEDIIEAKNVRVGEYNGQPQYTAESVVKVEAEK